MSRQGRKASWLLAVGIVSLAVLGLFAGASNATVNNWGPEHRHSTYHLTDTGTPHTWHFMNGSITDVDGAEVSCVKGTKTATGTILEFACWTSSPWVEGTLCTPSVTEAYFTAKWAGGSSRPEVGYANTAGGC